MILIDIYKKVHPGRGVEIEISYADDDPSSTAGSKRIMITKRDLQDVLGLPPRRIMG